MAIGDITGEIASLEWDADRGWYPNIIHVSDDVYAISYEGPDGDGWLKTVSISDDGVTISVIDSFEFDETYGIYPTIIHVLGDVYAIAYSGPSDDGWLKTVGIQSDGTITGTIDSFEFDAVFGLYPDITHVTGDIYAIPYDGPDYDGWLKTVGIQSDGTITGTIDSFEFDTVNGRSPDIINIAGDIYAIAYEGPDGDGWLKTVGILSNGTITGTIDSFEFDTVDGIDPNIINIAGDIYAIAYEGPGGDGLLKTVGIQSDGTITGMIDSFVFVSGWWSPMPHIIGVVDDVYAIAYMGNFDHCWLQTVEIQSDGTITGMIDSFDVDSSLGTVTPWLIRISSGVYSVTYGGPGDDGWLKTIGIETPSEAAHHRFIGFTGGFPHRSIH